MWKPWRLTNLWTSTACYRDSFTFFLTFHRRATAVSSESYCDSESAAQEATSGSHLWPRHPASWQSWPTCVPSSNEFLEKVWLRASASSTTQYLSGPKWLPPVLAIAKKHLGGREFLLDFEVKETTTWEWLDAQDTQFFQDGLNKLECRWDVAYKCRAIMWKSDFFVDFSPECVICWFCIMICEKFTNNFPIHPRVYIYIRERENIGLIQGSSTP
jgi:hypothetical protein